MKMCEGGVQRVECHMVECHWVSLLVSTRITNLSALLNNACASPLK